MNVARCFRNLQSPVANRPRTARAISFSISIRILRPSCSGDNGPFVLPKEHLSWLNEHVCESRSRSEERRVGKECRSRWAQYHERKKSRKVWEIEIKKNMCR